VLVELYAHYDGGNNGRLFLSVREAARRTNISKSTAATAFAALVQRGFIRPNVKGAFSLKQRHATSWILTEFAHGGHIATKDFMPWQPDSKNQNTVRLQGQMFRPEGQMGDGAQKNCSICPSGRTDSLDLERPRSLGADTDSLPRGVAK